MTLLLRLCNFFFIYPLRPKVETPVTLAPERDIMIKIKILLESSERNIPIEYDVTKCLCQ